MCKIYKIHEGVPKIDKKAQISNVLTEIEKKAYDLIDKGEELDTEIESMIKEREEARKNKDWALSDELRDKLKEEGILVEDTPEGTIWKKIN